MKKAKFLSLLLVVALVLMPLTAHAALPRTFDKSRVHRLDDYNVELKISDMTFQGTFTNAELSDEKIEQMVRKVLAEMGLTEADFDMLNDLVDTMKKHDTISQEQMEKIFDRWLTMLGPVPGVGTAATIVQILLLINKGDYSGAATDAAIAAGEKVGEKVVVKVVGEELAEYVNIGYNIGKALDAAIEGMMESNTGQRALDRALGLEAYKTINSFYSKLNAEVDKHYKQNGPDFMVKFDKAKAEKKPVTLFDTENFETWTLDMTLFQTESYNRLDIDGQYEGQYVIEIDYDLSGFQQHLNDIVQTPEWRKTIVVFDEWETAWGSFDIAATNPGNCDVKRKLEGYATAILYRKGGQCRIKATEERSTMDTNVSGIVIEASAQRDESRLDIATSVSADENAFTNQMTKWTVTWPEDVINVPADMHVYEISWSDGMWRRASNYERDWKIALSPLKRK